MQLNAGFLRQEEQCRNLWSHLKAPGAGALRFIGSLLLWMCGQTAVSIAGQVTQLKVGSQDHAVGRPFILFPKISPKTTHCQIKINGAPQKPQHGSWPWENDT